MRLCHVLLASVVCVAALCVADPLPPISKAQSVALVEFKTGKLNDATVVTAENARNIVSLTASSPSGTVTATVDTIAARVLDVSVNGSQTYTFPGVVAVGHRGTVKFAPENTIAAFNKAIEIGVDLLEMDVRETSDGQLVIMHDSSIDRTTDGSGDVARITLDEIRRHDAGVKFSNDFKGERAPTFEEALKAIHGRALPDIDFKAGDPKKVIDAVRAAGLVGKCTLYCGDWYKLEKTLELEKGFIIRPTAPKGMDGLEKVVEKFDPPIVNVDWAYFSGEFIRAIHLKGKFAFVNTMGEQDGRETIARAIDAGADYMQSDQIDVLMEVLHEKGLHK